MYVPQLKSFLRLYHDLPQEAQKYLGDFEKLAKMYPYGYEIALCYLFFRIEGVQRRLLYRGLIECHNINRALALDAANKVRMFRGNKFNKLFFSVFNVKPPKLDNDETKKTIKTRGDVVHGSDNAKYEDVRLAIAYMLKYVKLLNEEVQRAKGFSLFSDLRTMKRPKLLDEPRSRECLKNLKFSGI